jgi:SulP family sulfate permease
MINKVFPFLSWLPLVNGKTMRADLMAGLTGAVIVLPQGVAFAMIAGMPPIYGLYTAMITPIIAALFGSSFHLISGPTTAISIVVFSAISGFGVAEGTEEFVALALSLTFLAGLIQLALGLVRLGTLVNFVSHTVVIGFTAGAGILIAGKQLKHVFGISIKSGTPFYEILYEITTRISETNWYAFAVAASTLLIAIIIRKLAKRLPYMLIAMVGGSVIAILLGGQDVGILFVNEMPSQLPPFRIPDLSLETLQKLAPNAFAIAMLGLIEAVAIARAIALHTRQRIDGNQEFIGQGLSNLVGSFFSCYAGSGSFTRSGVNHQAGAKTPIAAIIAAILLMLVVVFVAPLAAYLPIPAMGGIILLVGYNLVDFHHIKEIIRASRLETTVLGVTFFSTLFLDLEFAIYVGMIFSLIFYLQKTSAPNIALLTPDPKDDSRKLTNLIHNENLNECPQMKIIRIDDALYYGSIEHVSTFMSTLHEGEERHLILMAHGINFVDLAGAEWLVQEANRWKEKGGSFSICGLKLVAQDILIKGGFKEKIGEENFYIKKTEAIHAIYQRLDKTICKACSARIFLECQEEFGKG